VFLGSIEGVSGDGLLGAANFEFTVKKISLGIRALHNLRNSSRNDGFCCIFKLR